MTFKVFVSGNQTELSGERFAVKDVITNNPIFKEFFEVFLFEEVPATNRSPVLTYLEEVKSSDIFIGILGKNYGSINEEGLSPTEKEIRTFIGSNPHKDLVIFIKGINDQNKDEKVQNLIDFIKNPLIRPPVTYKRFESLTDLKKDISDSLVSFLHEKRVINAEPFDEKVRLDLGYDDLDEKEVNDFLLKRAFKLSVDVPSTSIKDVLMNILKVLKKVNGELKPTNTALLFFSRNSSYLPQNVIKIARYNGTTRIETIDNKEITGPIYKMINEVEIFFKRNTRLANKIIDFNRVEIPEYPFEAIREALINAIAHRDYARQGAHIMFSIFDDRVEIRSPGGLLQGLNINSLEGQHEARNKKICDIFHETKDMERFGTGIEKMRNLMLNHGLKEPEFSEKGDSFVVTFFGPGQNILDLISSVPDERKTNLKELGLNDRQIKALEMMINEKIEFTNRLYQETFQMSDRTASRDLKELVDKEQVKSHGKGKARRYGIF